MVTEMWPSLVVNLELKTKLLSQEAIGTWDTDIPNFQKKKEITVNNSVSIT